MLKLVDILNIKTEDYKNYKIHFATGLPNKREAYNQFLINEFDEFQAQQTNKNFSRDYVISLIYYDKDIWLFGGVYKVDNQNPHPISHNDGERLALQFIAYRQSKRLNRQSFCLL